MLETESVSRRRRLACAPQVLEGGERPGAAAPDGGPPRRGHVQRARVDAHGIVRVVGRGAGVVGVFNGSDLAGLFPPPINACNEVVAAAQPVEAARQGHIHRAAVYGDQAALRVLIQRHLRAARNRINIAAEKAKVPVCFFAPPVVGGLELPAVAELPGRFGEKAQGVAGPSRPGRHRAHAARVAGEGAVAAQGQAVDPRYGAAALHIHARRQRERSQRLPLGHAVERGVFAAGGAEEIFAIGLAGNQAHAQAAIGQQAAVHVHGGAVLLP